MLTPNVADSFTIVEYTNTMGTGPYALQGAIAGSFRFRDAHADGESFDYIASDGPNGPNIEVVTGTLTYGSPDTLSRDTIQASSNGGNPIYWLGDTRPLVREVAASGGIDDDTCDMQNVDMGITYSVTLTKFDTQVIWNSVSPGSKTTTIPGATAANKGFTLDIKTTLGDSTTHNIIPTSGTIGGLPGLTFTDTNCNLFLRSNAAKSDWLIRCLCCYTPIPIPVVPTITIPPSVIGSTFYGAQASSSATNTFTISAVANDVIILQIQNNNRNIGMVAVSSVSGGGLVWAKLIGGTINALSGVYLSDAEIWWARTPLALNTVPITVSFGASVYMSQTAARGIHGVNALTPWDTSGTFTNTDQSGSVTQPTVNISTTYGADLLLTFAHNVSPSIPLNVAAAGWTTLMYGSFSRPGGFLEFGSFWKTVTSAQPLGGVNVNNAHSDNWLTFAGALVGT